LYLFQTRPDSRSFSAHHNWREIAGVGGNIGPTAEVGWKVFVENEMGPIIDSFKRLSDRKPEGISFLQDKKTAIREDGGFKIS